VAGRAADAYEYRLPVGSRYVRLVCGCREVVEQVMLFEINNARWDFIRNAVAIKVCGRLVP
jgi:hypothetical protein